MSVQLNNAKAEILGGVSGSLTATTVTVKDGKGAIFGTNYPYRATMVELTGGIVSKREIISVTNRSGDTFTMTRAVEACPLNDNATTLTQTPQSFSDGALFQQRPTANIGQEIEDIKTDLTNLDSDKLDISTYDAEKAVYTSSSTGTDAYAVTVSEVTSYNAGQVFKVSADVANTGSATLEVNSLGAKTLKKLSNSAFNDLETGDIIANQIFWATYNGAEDVFQFSVDPANVAISVPSASETVEGVVERLTQSEALTMTDTTRYASAVHIKDMFNQLSNGSITEWDQTSEFTVNSVNEYTANLSIAGGGPTGLLTATSGSAYGYGQMPPKPSGLSGNLNRDEIEIIECEFNAIHSSNDGSFKCGFGRANASYTTTGSTFEKVIFEYANSTSVQLRTADGSSETASTPATIVNTRSNIFKIRYEKILGNAHLYINGVLQKTNTTNLPSGVGDLVAFGFGSDSSSDNLRIGPVKVRIKYT